MKIVVRSLAVLLALLALAAAGLGIYIALRWQGTIPQLVQVSSLAQQQMEKFFSSLCSGNYSEAQQLILGQPSLGMDRPAEDALAASVWDAYQSSLKFEALGEFYATESGMAIDYRVTRLDMTSVLEPVAKRTEILMQQRIEQAKRVEEVYDSENEYRQDVVQAVLDEAVAASLQEDAQYIQREFTLELVYQDGTWLMVGTDALMAAITAGFGG